MWSEVENNTRSADSVRPTRGHFALYGTAFMDGTVRECSPLGFFDIYNFFVQIVCTQTAMHCSQFLAEVSSREQSTKQVSELNKIELPYAVGQHADLFVLSVWYYNNC